jgi:hypothetical protein
MELSLSCVEWGVTEKNRLEGTVDKLKFVGRSGQS